MPLTTTFQLVRKVLGELYAEIVANEGSEAAADKSIAAKLEELSTKYANLTDEKMEPIDYSSPLTRFAYIFSAVTCHSDFVYQGLQMMQAHIAPIFSKDAKCVVSCPGGGPGSDLIGLVRYLLEAKSQPKSVVCYLCDREQAWADSWTELGQELESPFPIFVNFQPLDVTEPASWQKQKKFMSADLFIASYFASEVMRLGAKAHGFWQELFNNAKSGALFLVADFASDASIAYIDSITKEIGWELLDVNSKRRFVSFSEQKSELADFMAKFGKSPRVQGELHVRLLRKP